MGMNFPELSLDSIHIHHHPKTIPEFLRELSMIKDSSEKSSKLEEYVKQLEDELRKIDAFKRELPLCMLLLNDAIVRLTEESLQQPVMEEFIAMKGNCDENERPKLGHDYSDKKSWMSSAQLWSTNTSYDKPQQDSVIELQKNEEDDGSASGNPFQSCKSRNRGETYMPFECNSGFKATKMKKEKKQVIASVPGLSLMPPIATELGSRIVNSKIVGVTRGGSGSPFLIDQLKLQTKPQQPRQQQQQASRKQRRSWSQELHRRFVNVLQQLGGSQVATPKQIRELMQVDGLTNDEVKSHLQKYRLHVRKLPTHDAAAANGLCVSQDQCGSLSKASNSQSSSPRGPLHLKGSAKGMSTTGCESMEDEEDERTEGHSWKGQFHMP